MKEAPIEANIVDAYTDSGGIAFKLSPQGNRGAPDRGGFLPIKNEKHREIVAKYVRFIEAKAPGKTAETHQVRMHKRLRKMGYVVEVVDDHIYDLRFK